MIQAQNDEDLLLGDQSGFKIQSFIDEKFFKTIPVKNLAPQYPFISRYFPTPLKSPFFICVSHWIDILF